MSRIIANTKAPKGRATPAANNNAPIPTSLPKQCTASVDLARMPQSDLDLHVSTMTVCNEYLDLHNDTPSHARFYYTMFRQVKVSCDSSRG